MGKWLGLSVLMAALVCGTSARADEAATSGSPRMAMGLIVKLKDAKPQSVVRLKASSVPSDGFSRQRQRLSDAARRKRVSFLVQRPTAFAANVIHPGYPITLAEANAQAQRLRADPDVEWVVVNEIVKRQSQPTDPGYIMGDTISPSAGSGQVWLQPRTSQTQGVANFPAAWSFLDGLVLAPVVVAVLDTGILPHPDLDGRLLPGYDFVYNPLASGDSDGVDNDPTDQGDWISQSDKDSHPEVFNSDCEVENKSSWHGLAIAGMLVANANNGQYGAGMLESLSGPVGRNMLIPVRVAGKCGAEVSSIIEGMLWASGVSYQGAPALPAHPAKIINLSFAGDGTCQSTDPNKADGLYRQTIAVLRNNGVLLVVAAGNGDGVRGDPAPAMPASCSNVLAVTGLNQRGYKATYANLITQGVAVAAGDAQEALPHYFSDDGIYTTSNAGAQSPDLTPSGYIMTQHAGTSFAAPQAVGVAAMMLAVNPSLSVDQLIAGIKNTSQPFQLVSGQAACVAGGTQQQGNCSCTTATCGQGVLDALGAVAWAASATATTAASPIGSAPYFVPSRLSATRASSGGGGGGSLDSLTLLGLAGITAFAAFKSAWRPRQRRQAAKPLP